MTTNVPTIDDNCWPIIVVRFFDQTSVADTAVFLAHLERFYARKQPFVSIVDLRGLNFLGTSASVRKLVAERINALQAHYAGYKRGEATLVDSASNRAIMTATSLQRQQPYATAVFVDMDEALTWATRLLRA